jgi:hypothetical protein
MLISALIAKVDAAWENTHALANGDGSSVQLELANAYL